MAAIEDTKDVCFEDGPKVFNAHRFNRSEYADAGVVDKDVETAELFCDFSDNGLHLLVVANITNITGSSPGAGSVRTRRRLPR